MRAVFLIGPRGSGKSETAAALAKKCGCPALDTDDLVSQSVGKSIAEIVAGEGWSAFRAYEREALRRAVDMLTRVSARDMRCGVPSGIVATGGGAVLDPENRGFMTRNGLVVYLDTPESVLLRRLQAAPNEAQRPPLANGRTLADDVAAILQERGPLYRETAHHVLDGSLPVAELAEKLRSLCFSGSGR
jgi:shikimate kinase